MWTVQWHQEDWVPRSSYSSADVLSGSYICLYRGRFPAFHCKLAYLRNRWSPGRWYKDEGVGLMGLKKASFSVIGFGMEGDMVGPCFWYKSTPLRLVILLQRKAKPVIFPWHGVFWLWLTEMLQEHMLFALFACCKPRLTLYKASIIAVSILQLIQWSRTVTVHPFSIHFFLLMSLLHTSSLN